jgi:hypothetical protein
MNTLVNNFFGSAGFDSNPTPFSLLERLALMTQTAIFTGDEGEQQLYSYTLPANFFAEPGGKIDATIRLKVVAGANGLTGATTIKLDGTEIFNFSNSTSEGETFIGPQTSLIELVELAGAISFANLGNLGYQTYNNSVSHTLTFHYVDYNSDSSNSFRGAYVRITYLK